MNKPYVIGTSAGPSHWTTLPLSIILQAQPHCEVSLDLPPVLNWSYPNSDSLRQRIKRLSTLSSDKLRIDLAGFVLPHLEATLSTHDALKVIHVVGGELETVLQEYLRFLDRAYPLPTSHWTSEVAGRWEIDPIWERGYPKYNELDRNDAIRKYVAEYEAELERLQFNFPAQILIVQRDELFTPTGVERILEFAEIPRESRKLIGPTPGASARITPHPRLGVRSVSPLDPQRCCILVPCNSYIHNETESVLRELEERGYPVRRIYGLSAIDQARSRMATDAILDGYEETLWIDSDMVFHPDAVEQIRSHQELIVSGLYSKRGGGSLASVFEQNTEALTLGNGGRLTAIKYAATGFLLVRRNAYLKIQQTLKLPICNELFTGRPLIPFFQPMLIDQEESTWYLAEDYSFSERAHQSGLQVLADTSLRLWHVGTYHYGWEDAIKPPQRVDSFKFNVRPTTMKPADQAD